MNGIFALLMGFGQAMSGLHFSVRTAVFALLICLVHTGGALILMAYDLIDSDIARLMLEFSMSGTLFIILGLTVAARRSKHVCGNCHRGSSKNSPPPNNVKVEINTIGGGTSVNTGDSDDDGTDDTPPAQGGS